MKLTRLFFALIFIFTSIACFAQDYRLSLGKSYFRYDSDSNKIRIGGPSIPKLATELDARLFDFNLDQFFWDKSRGLCIRDLVKYDSTKARKIIVYSDTGDGEIIPYQIRSYTLYKPYFANSPDLFDLHVLYQSSDNTQGTIGRSQDFNLINTVYNLYENLNQIDITVMGYAVQVSPFSRPGNYLLTLNYEYEFVNAIDDGQDEINIIITYNSTEIRNYHHRLKHARLTSNDLRLSSSIIIPINISDITQILEIQIFGNNSLSTRLYLYNLSVSAVLIN